MQDITSQINKFATLTTLLSEEEAFVIRDLTMMGGVTSGKRFRRGEDSVH